MENKKIIFLLLVFMNILIKLSSAQEERMRKLLVKKLLENYDKTIQASGTVMLLFFKYKVHVDETNEEVMFNFIIGMEWRDPQLSWNVEEFSNIPSATVDSKKIWRPELIPVVSYRANVEEFHKRSQPTRLFNSVIHHDGNIWNVYSITLTTHCQMSTENWPKDVQYCNLKFGIPINSNYSIGDYNMESASLAEPFQWNVKIEFVSNKLAYNETNPLFKETLTMKVILTHKATLLTAMFVFPSITIMLIILVTFWLKPQNPNRLMLLGVLVPTETYFLDVLIAYIPYSGLVVPEICYRLGTMFNVSIFCILETIFNRVLLASKINPPWLCTVHLQITKIKNWVSSRCKKNINSIKLEEAEVDESENQISGDVENDEEKEKVNVLEDVITFIDSVAFVIVFLLYAQNSVLLINYL